MPRKGISWEDVLKRSDLVGGVIESIVSDTKCRGPIEAITIRNGIITITSPWTACQNKGDASLWEKRTDVTALNVNPMFSQPFCIGGSSIHFLLPLIGECTLFPKGACDLDPRKVEGLLM